jgi:Flp pilus assembly secretin CpaC
VIIENRKTARLLSVINQPILSNTDLIRRTSKVEYLPIGTQIAACPTRLTDGQIDLQFSVSLSEIIGSEIAEGNTYPIVSNREHEAAVKFCDGESVWLDGFRSGDGGGKMTTIVIQAKRSTESAASK